MILSSGTILRERYRIEGVLGRGGMGTVYLARQLDLDRTVALKTITGGDPEFVERFRREAKVLSSLSHPNVVQVVDFFPGDADTPAYLVMDRVSGRALGELVRDRGPLTEARAIEIGLQLTDAVSAAHAAGIIHRDIKPANVLLVETTLGRDNVKLLDFGVARDLRSTEELTRDGAVVGTLGWLSPEQVLGEVADVQSDVYAIGATLYFCMLGRKPYGQASLGELAAAITSGDHELASRARPSSALAAVIDRAMDHDRSARFASAAELGRALVNAKATSLAEAGSAKGEPTRAAPEPRRPRSRAAIVVAVLTTIALTIAIVFGARHFASTLEAPSPSASSSVPERTETRVDAASASGSLVPPSLAVVGDDASSTSLPPSPSTRAPLASASASNRPSLSSTIPSSPLGARHLHASATSLLACPNGPDEAAILQQVKSADLSACDALAPDPYNRYFDLAIDRSGKVVSGALARADARCKEAPPALTSCVVAALKRVVGVCSEDAGRSISILVFVR